MQVAIILSSVASFIIMAILYQRGYFRGPDYKWKKQQEELEKAKSYGDADAMAKCYYKLGLLAHKKKDLNTAESFYRQSLDITRKLGYEQGVASLLYQLGWMSLERNNVDQAIAQLEEALSILESRDFPEKRDAKEALEYAKKQKAKKNTIVSTSRK